jgi:hypothetical protein
MSNVCGPPEPLVMIERSGRAPSIRALSAASARGFLAHPIRALWEGLAQSVAHDAKALAATVSACISSLTPLTRQGKLVTTQPSDGLGFALALALCCNGGRRSLAVAMHTA